MSSSGFGDYLREKRLEKNFTLRAFCERFGLDTAYISRLETAKLKPPSTEKLTAIAEALGLQKNSKDWIKFFDLAHQARNELPEDVKQNAPEIISMLPAFLRTPDGKRVSKEKIEKLIRFLENKGSE
ncbi:MAG: transcription regulator [Candidatus Curtissbacteria bacterium GW2011_GWA1_40_16]|uniref:Transcription regulator n=1 Tax=Candidatus Curtissbacteria bacterium GW2011_GWA1_40_16 TaxID=1618405 RepID=A0A0G0TVA4_9BACT|nr:MAG: transcription regulator [Candidatus Curtissbacteria bacterium GW2011_GWA1_40_16]